MSDSTAILLLLQALQGTPLEGAVQSTPPRLECAETAECISLADRLAFTALSHGQLGPRIFNLIGTLTGQRLANQPASPDFRELQQACVDTLTKGVSQTALDEEQIMALAMCQELIPTH